jgi:hypothetical protein
MPRRLTEWEVLDLEQAANDAADTESGSAGARHAILIMMLCALGYGVTNTAKAIEMAYDIVAKWSMLP